MANQRTVDGQKEPLTRRINARLTEAEHALIEEKRAAAGMNASEFFRECVLTNRTQIVARPQASGDRKQLLYAVNKVGNNLNQLAHAVNTAHMTERVSEATYLSVLDHLRWFQQYLKGMVDRVD